MPRKNNKDKKGGRTSRSQELRTPRTKPRVDLNVADIHFMNVDLLNQFVTDEGRILPRKYTGLPALYQRRMTRAVKQARQALLMK
jgi:small subunit ribosomal protein S18